MWKDRGGIKLENIDITDFAIANLIDAMGMFIHDMDVLLNKKEEGVYYEGSYNRLAEQVRRGNTVIMNKSEYDKWILCSERLPELSARFRDNFYLVKLYGAFNDLIEVGYAHFVNRPERTWEIMSEHSEKYWRVISWQKLPESELYKEE